MVAKNKGTAYEILGYSENYVKSCGLAPALEIPGLYSRGRQHVVKTLSKTGRAQSQWLFSSPESSLACLSLPANPSVCLFVCETRFCYAVQALVLAM